MKKLYEKVKLNLTQILSLHILVAKLCCRRYAFNAVIFIVPVLSLAIIMVIKYINGEYVIPLANEVLKNSPGGSERFIDPKKVFSYEKLANLFLETYDTSPIVLYKFGLDDLNTDNDNSKIREMVLQLRHMTNITGTGLMYERMDDEIEIEIYSSILKENSDTGVTNNVFGALYFGNINSSNLVYGIQNEQKMLRHSPAEVPTLVRRVLSNHSDSTRFCTSVGGFLGSFECDIFVFNLLKQLINTKFIYDKTGRIVKSGVSQIPYYTKGKHIENLKHEIICASMIPMMCLVAIVYFVNHIVLDKENKSREMMKVMGLMEHNYHIVLSTFFMLYNFFFYLFYYLAGRFVFEFRFFTQIHPVLFIIVFTVISLSCVSFSFLVSAFFNSSFNATFFTFSFVLSISQALSNVLDGVERSLWYVKPIDFIFPCNICHLISRLKFPTVYDKVYLNIDYLYRDTDLLISLIISILGVIFYFFMYLYFERVIPQPYGVRKKWYYPVTWVLGLFSKKNKNLNDEEKNDKVDLDIFGISVLNMWKRYGKIEAVRGVSYDVRKNEIFGLFGPNGCGKTSSINAFVGIYDVSDGDVYICGENINTNLKSVRQKIGICPQHSVLWKELSIKDHLRFYSGMRGMSIFGKKLNRSIDKIMTQTKLKEDKETKKTVFQKFVDWFFARDKIGVKSMSTQRKLSLAISLIGDCSVIILDEPTVGISHMQKKEIWEIIKNIKNENRSILLTTHCMRTGEYLCDRICIMSKGEVKCIGTPSELKNEHGKGHVLSIHHDGRSIQKLLDFVNNNIESGDRKLIKNVGTTLQWEYKQKKGSKFGEELIKKQKELGVIDWSVKLTSLEDVFVSVSLEEEDETSLLRSHFNIKPNVSSKIVYSIYEKKWEEVQYEKNSIKLYFQQFFVMVKSQFLLSIRLWIGWLLQIIFSIIMVSAMVASQVFGGRADSPIIHRNFKRILPFSSTQCESWDSPCYNLVYTTNNNSFAEKVVSVMFDTDIAGLSLDDSILKFDSEIEMNDWLRNNPNRTTVALSFEETETLPADDFIGIPEHQFTSYHIYFNSTSPTFYSGDSTICAKELSLAVDNAILEIDTGQKDTIILSNKNYPRVPFPHQYHEYDGYHQTGSMFIIFILILYHKGVVYNASGLFVIIFVFYLIIIQRQNRWTKYLRFMGMRIPPIFLSFVLIYLALAIFYVISTYVTSIILRIPLVVNSSFIVPTLALFLNSISFYCFSIVWMNFVTTMNGFWAFCLVSGIGSYFFFLVMDTTAIYGVFQKSGWFVKYFFLPLLFYPFNFSKVFSDLANRTLPIFDFTKRIFQSNVGYNVNSLWDVNKIEVLGLTAPPTLVSLFYMVANSFVYFFFYILIQIFIERRNLFSWKTSVDARDMRLNEGNGKQKICMSSSLVKNYFLKKVLKNINLEVYNGDAISIVGENKVGKTTLLEVLIGWTEKTSGKLKVFGKTPSLNHGIDIGYLPQESFLLNLFSGRQIVELCSIAKGLKWSCIPRHIIKLFVDVDLLGSENKAVKSYSGGMMRRLAAALSLIGFPKMLVLDEMSRGIDPISKQKIWNLVAKNNTEKGTTVLFSTHEIDTATEILGTKIAFLVDGKIQKFETTNKLKDDFTKGILSLRLYYETNKEEELRKFVAEKISSNYELREDGSIVVKIKDYTLGKVLKILGNRRNIPKYSCYEVSQICFQDIYEKVVFHGQDEKSFGSSAFETDFSRENSSFTPSEEEYSSVGDITSSNAEMDSYSLPSSSLTQSDYSIELTDYESTDSVRNSEDYTNDD